MRAVRVWPSPSCSSRASRRRSSSCTFHTALARPRKRRSPSISRWKRRSFSRVMLAHAVDDVVHRVRRAGSRRPDRPLSCGWPAASFRSARSRTSAMRLKDCRCSGARPRLTRAISAAARPPLGRGLGLPALALQGAAPAAGAGARLRRYPPQDGRLVEARPRRRLGAVRRSPAASAARATASAARRRRRAWPRASACARRRSSSARRPRAAGGEVRRRPRAGRRAARPRCGSPRRGRPRGATPPAPRPARRAAGATRRGAVRARPAARGSCLRASSAAAARRCSPAAFSSPSSISTSAWARVNSARPAAVVELAQHGEGLRERGERGGGAALVLRQPSEVAERGGDRLLHAQLAARAPGRARKDLTAASQSPRASSSRPRFCVASTTPLGSPLFSARSSPWRQ